MTNKELIKEALKLGLKVIEIDIETSPHLLYGYGLFNQNFSTEQIKIPGKITSIAYKSLNNKTCYAMGWDYDYDIMDGDDTHLLEVISEVINDADIVLAQNGDAFDIKWIQWRLNCLKLPPLKLENLVTLDTLKLSRKAFRPPSHKLDYRSKAYGLGGKIDQTMRDIINVAQGDEKAQEKRIRYNIKDVMDMEKIFYKELDYVFLPRKIVRSLEAFIAEHKFVPHCLKCSIRRQAKFAVSEKKEGDRIRYTCNRCLYTWRKRK